MILAKHQAALLFAFEEAERGQKQEQFPELLAKLTVGVVKMIKNHQSRAEPFGSGE